MKRVFLCFLLNYLVIFSAVALAVPILFVVTLLAWLNLVFYASANIEKRYALLIFLVSYFIFLLGQEFCIYYLGFEQEYYFSDAINNHAYLLLLFGLLGLSAGFVGFEKLTNASKKVAYSVDTPIIQQKNQIVKKLAQIGMLISTVPYYYVGISKGQFVLNNSYLEFYTSYTSDLPGIVINLSELFPLFFFMFLATMPTKRETRWPMLAYLGYGVVFLMTGRRIQIGMALMMALSYYLMRHFRNKREKWITRLNVVATAFLIPLIVILLYMLKYTRYGKVVEGDNIIEMFFTFFYQQGTSINVIKFAKQFEGDTLGLTSIYYSLKFFRTNVITSRLSQFPTVLYRLRNAEKAYFTNSLPDYIYYRISPYYFQKGYGLGASYLSELYHDGGHFLTIVGSVFYGAVLQGLYKLRSNVWVRTIAFLVLEQLFILPRYGADSFLRSFYNIINIVVFFTLMLLTNLILKQQRYRTVK